MAKLTFYFDPLCPWAWRTALWVHEVQKQHPLDVQWRVFSLREINRDDDPLAVGRVELDAALRVLVAARRVCGNDAVSRLYLALGHARHDRHENLKDTAVLEAAVVEAGLDRSLVARALDDRSTDDEALAEHREAVDGSQAFGVPWLVLDDRTFGFYGPIVLEVPTGQAALELWDHTSWLLTQSNFYEIKRNRTA